MCRNKPSQETFFEQSSKIHAVKRNKGLSKEQLDFRKRRKSYLAIDSRLADCAAVPQQWKGASHLVKEKIRNMRADEADHLLYVPR